MDCSKRRKIEVVRDYLCFGDCFYLGESNLSGLGGVCVCEFSALLIMLVISIVPVSQWLKSILFFFSFDPIHFVIFLSRSMKAIWSSSQFQNFWLKSQMTCKICSLMSN